MSAAGDVRGWLPLRVPVVGLREGSENTLLAPSGNFEVGEPRLGKPLASLDAFQHPGLKANGQLVSPADPTQSPHDSETCVMPPEREDKEIGEVR